MSARLSACCCAFFTVSFIVCSGDVFAQTSTQQAAPMSPPPIALPANLPVLSADQQARMDRDLLETDVMKLQRMYAAGKYTVTDVTKWYLGRIAKYNGVYRAVQTVDVAGALAAAAQEDHEPKGRPRAPLWGVSVVIKANTSVKGLIESDGWQGFALPGHELIAAKDAAVVAKLRAAGAVIIGITNMPDFAASDTNRSTAFGRTGNAYDVRFSPGGSSGGTVTAVTANFAMLGTGTDTANSIRMPAGTSSVVGVLPTRGLVSIAGIAPLDWLLDNTGPIARDVQTAAIALGVMAQTTPDPLDFKTATPRPAQAQTGPYIGYLKPDALKGKRFGVPAFMLAADPPAVLAAAALGRGNGNAMRPETRALLMQCIAAMRRAGAEVIIDDTLLPESFTQLVRKETSTMYRLDGANQFLAQFGTAQYHSAAEYEKAVGSPIPASMTGINPPGTPVNPNRPVVAQVALQGDASAEANYFAPQSAALAEYVASLDRLHLDGLVYPSAQMPPPDETMPQNGSLSSGPHSNTGWVNKIGVPAVVVPGGFYDSGLPFGLEMSARPWRDGDLLGWAYSFEQSTKLRKPPVLVESGLLPKAY